MRLLLINAPAGFVQAMSQRGHHLMVADASVAHLENQIQSPHCQFVKLWGRRKIDIPAIRLMRKTIREFEPDLIHAFLPSSLAQAVIGSFGLRVKPKIVSFRGITRVPSWLDPAEWITYLSPRVSLHACESQAVMQAMQQGGIRTEKCEVIYNCVTPVAAAESREESLARFGLPANAFVVGSAACVRPVKGIDVLVRAAAECAELPDIYFLVLGQQKDPKVTQLARDMRLQARLKMPGHIHDAQRLMRVFDLFVMPSRREGLCRALLEAMDQAICPIVSDAGGMKEMVRHGTDGIVFPTENVAALRDAITQLHGDRETLAKFGSSAQTRVREICSPHQFAGRLEAMYKRLCERGL